MAKIILGIHGLGNKVPRRLLTRWWRTALEEGLGAIGHRRRLFQFRLVYWADFLHPVPLDPEVKDKKDLLYNDTPYIPSPSGRGTGPKKISKRVLDYLERQLYKIILKEDFSLDYGAVEDLIIRRYFRDLDVYYSKQCRDRKRNLCRARDVIRDDLARVLRKYRRRDILLIAHSMGSIVAYDVLTQLVPDIRIHTLVTMGSPLGLPVIMLKILSEQHKKPRRPLSARTPENIVGTWYNFSDPQDKVAADYTLSEDYKENSRHVRPIDIIVHNDYEHEGDPNPHSVYGYLRSPEMARVIYNFLHYRRPKPLIWLSDTVHHLFKRRARPS